MAALKYWNGSEWVYIQKGLDGSGITDQLKLVDMSGGDTTVNAADSAAYNTVIVSNTGDGTQAIRVLTFTAGTSNPAQLTIINTGTQPIRVTSGEGTDQVVFKRAVLVYQNGTGFRYADDESIITAAAPFGTQKGASAGEQLVGSIQIPRGTLKQNGDCLDIEFFATKGGTTTTETIRFELGTTRGTGATTVVTLGGLATTNDNMYGRVTLVRTSATTIKMGTTTGWHVPYAVGTNEATDVTVTNMDSNDLFLNVTAETTAGAGNETVDFRRLKARVSRG